MDAIIGHEPNIISPTGAAPQQTTSQITTQLVAVTANDKPKKPKMVPAADRDVALQALGITQEKSVEIQRWLSPQLTDLGWPAHHGTPRMNIGNPIMVNIINQIIKRWDVDFTAPDPVAKRHACFRIAQMTMHNSRDRLRRHKSQQEAENGGDSGEDDIDGSVEDEGESMEEYESDAIEDDEGNVTSETERHATKKDKRQCHRRG